MDEQLSTLDTLPVAIGLDTDARQARQTGGLAVARQLAIEGISDLFVLPGVQLDCLTDGLRQCQDDVRIVVPRHEHALTFMADGYARSTGRIGACLMVPGPGVLNAMAGLATAFACNSRVMCIAGDIPSPWSGRNIGMMHEVGGQTEILAKVTKWQGRPAKLSEVPHVIHDAAAAARSGRPRPVAVEMPQDLLSAEGDVPLVMTPHAPRLSQQPDPAAVCAAAALLDRAEYPVIYVGGGGISVQAGSSLQRLAERLDVPVVMSENGRGALSDRHPLALNTLAGRAVFERADVVLIVGSRFIDASTGRPAWPALGIRTIHIDLDPKAWSDPRTPAVAIEADAAAAMDALAAAVARRASGMSRQLGPVKAWAQGQIDLIEPQASWIRALRNALPDDGFLVNELTQVGYLARVAFPVYFANSFITAGYQETLGYGFPTGLGVAIGNLGRAVVCVSGDGGFGYSMQELATARKYGIDIVVVIFNDGRFGNVSLLQRQQFGHSYGDELLNPDFSILARAFGVSHAIATSPEELEDRVRSALSAGGPAIVEVPVGDLPSPWHLLRLVPRQVRPAPPNPLLLAPSAASHPIANHSS